MALVVVVNAGAFLWNLVQSISIEGSEIGKLIVAKNLGREDFYINR